jgi:hypothetical protein
LGETKNEGSEKNLKPAQAREGAKPSSREKTWKIKVYTVQSSASPEGWWREVTG